MNNNNPLLSEFDTLHHTAPFNKIQLDNYKPSFIKAIELSQNDIDLIVNNTNVPTFDNTIVALDNAGDRLDKISSIFFNLNAAETNRQMQALAREISPLLSKHSNDILLNDKLFEKIKFVFDNEDKESLSNEQIKLLDDTYNSFTRNGALLSKSDKEELRKISEELSNLTLKFGENVLIETNDFVLNISDSKDLAGLPQSIIDAAADVAKQKKQTGWSFTLQYPSYVPFMKYADNRELRKAMFMAYANRANNNNDKDNKKIIYKIVNLRLKKANLLGYATYADFVLEKRMAKSVENVNKFLDDLLNKSISFAKKDIDDVKNFAKTLGFNDTLERWDYSYYSEKLKNKVFDYTEEQTKPYFELNNVKNAVFALATRLYDIHFKLNKKIEVYHPEVEVYEVFDKEDNFLAVLYLDFHPREGKQGGAWMTNYGEQYIINGKNIRPHVSLVTNFSRPTGNIPSLLTYNEVITFMHEFGHGLHGMLSNTTYRSQSGTNVYRDFVELPSQFFENWGTQKEWIQSVGVHYKTGEIIPDKLVDKIINSINFQSGYQMVRQLSFGINDMAWHTLTSEFNDDVIAFEEKVMEPTQLFVPVEGTCFSTGFSHIFAGGYAAGYYGYKWAEVLDADAFSVFKKNGIFNKKYADKFKNCILTKGSTKHPMDLYIDFRGAEPSIDALMERSGLVK